MTEALPTAPTPTTPPPQFASGWQRLGAMIIDGSLIGLASATTTTLIQNYLFHYLFWFFLTALYFVLCESLTGGATLGKKIVGICVVDCQYRNISVFRSLGRYALWLLPSFPSFYLAVSPEFLQYMQNMQDHMYDPITMGQIERSPIEQAFLHKTILFSLASLLLSLASIGIPVLVTKEHTGLNDYFSKTRVCRTRATQLAQASAVKLASGWQRAGAIGLDCIIAIVAVKLVHIFIPYRLPIGLPLIAFLSLYCIALEASPFQATLGKRLVGIFITTKAQTRCSFLRTVARVLLFLTPVLPLLATSYFIDLGHIFLELQKHGNDAKQIQAAFFKPEVLYPFSIYTASTFFVFFGTIIFQWVPIFATAEHTSLHDWLSGTRVYKGKPQSLATTANQPSAPSAPDAAA